MQAVQHVAEYLALRTLLVMLRLMPLTVAAAVARRLADAIYLVARRRRRVACANVLRSGVAADEQSARRIVRASFRHFAVMLVESMAGLSVYPTRPWEDFVSVHAPPETLALLNDPAQGVIAVTGHIGNWETAGWMLSSIKPVLAVARPMNNPLVERFLQSRSSRARFNTIPKHARTARPLVQALRKGQMPALLVDQHTRDGIPIDFFGVPAMTHTSPARLHLMTGAPIIVGGCVHVAPLRYRIEFGLPIRITGGNDRNAAVRDILAAINAQLEEAIRRTPEQYLWAHRRWRNVEDIT